MATRTYGILWRWHFLAGLAACPVLIVIAITGALYAFQPELERVLSPELHEVSPGPTRLAIDPLIARLPADCAPATIDQAPRTNAAVVVWCAATPLRRVFLDPYTGRVLGSQTWDDSLFGIVLELHWELLLGERGRLVIEWATSWALLLMLSGAYLWWPRRKAGVWWPRRHVAGRQRLRDLHAIAGAYMLPVLLALAATGLFWTQLAGQNRWKPIAADAVSETWKAPPTSTVVSGATRIGYDRALAAAGIAGYTTERRVRVRIGAKPDAAYQVYVTDESDGSPSQAILTIVDAYDGRVLRRLDWDAHSALGKLDAAGYAIHVGAIAGLPGRILAVLAALVLATLCATGPWMWWKRRPRGQLGIPPRAERFAWPLLTALAILGVVLPTVGYTLLAVLAFELGCLAVAHRNRRAAARRVSRSGS